MAITMEEELDHEVDPSTESSSISSCDVNSNELSSFKINGCPSEGSSHESEKQPLCNEPTKANLDEHLLYTTGDLVWAYVSGYPLWPSVISFSPGENLFSKLTSKYCL